MRGGLALPPLPFSLFFCASFAFYSHHPRLLPPPHARLTLGGAKDGGGGGFFLPFPHHLDTPSHTSGLKTHTPSTPIVLLFPHH